MSHLLKINEVLELTGIPKRTLLAWMRNKLVIPAQRLGTGPGNGDKFSPQQACGLASIAALLAVAGRLDPKAVKDIMANWESLTDERMSARIAGEPHSAWDEEQAAADTHNAEPMDADERKVNDEMWTRITGVLNYLRDRQRAANRLIALAKSPVVSKVE